MIALLEEEYELALYRDYVGQSLWEIAAAAKGFGGVSHEMPQYVELSHPESKRNQPTAEDIKQKIYEELMG